MTHWRKIKNRMNYYHKKLVVGQYAEGCRGHPGIIIEKWFCPTDPYGCSVEIKSLVDGVEESCSMLHCAPRPIASKELAERMAHVYKTQGSREFAKQFYPEYYNDDEWVKFEETVKRTILNNGDPDGIQALDYAQAYVAGLPPERQKEFPTA
jgi:hypothetical protein